jgi:hypothetical protein
VAGYCASRSIGGGSDERRSYAREPHRACAGARGDHPGGAPVHRRVRGAPAGNVRRSAFHPLARIYWTTTDGTFDETLIANAHDGWANWDLHVTARFISVIQAGEVASVVFGFDVNDDPAQSWLDIHSLLRVDGTWKIMNKTATHACRADWAGLGASGQAAHTTK